MSSSPSPPNTGDLVLLVPTPGPLKIDIELLKQACSSLCSRIACDAMVLSPSDSNPLDALSASMDSTVKYDRIVVIPCGFESLHPCEIRAAWWFGNLPNTANIFLAEPWTPQEVGQWIGNLARSIKTSSDQSIAQPIALQLAQDPVTGSTRAVLQTELELQRDPVQQIERLALIAFWANRICPNAVVESATEMFSASQIDVQDIATWMVQRYLRALRLRPLPWNDHSDADWPMLSGLHKQLQQHLPSEYAERLDDVSAQSMGSAKIAPDESGLVPWDKIWTSFCDLAMAGGPPHRGTLLEPVETSRIEQSPEVYRAVVAEIRRGIGLASGLATCDSPYLGWVCIQCDSQQMAAWLMRAILVENISVRRESSKLYVPAGPDYRVEKEIKNVITAVAKTTHYWKAHLRSRQPPNPL